LVILGKDKFKKERAIAWNDEINPALKTMKAFAVNWTNPKNIERLRIIEENLKKFNQFQKEIEDIAQTVDNTPALKILLEDAAPQASILTSNITKMIDAEAAFDTASVLGASQGAAAALQLTKVATEQIVADRKYYTKNVILKLKRDWFDFKASVDHKKVQGAIPFPATFVREVSESLDKSAGYRYRLKSKHNINKQSGLSNKFEERAWDMLSKDSKTPYGEFLPAGTGVEYRYATADVAAAQGCVTCHNNHPDSPKTDFKLGDLMGLLIITAPISQDPKIAGVILKFANDEATKSRVSQAILDDVIQRKQILGMMADVRGTTGLGLANIRAYLLSGDVKFAKLFDKFWTKNARRFGDLNKNVRLMTPEQKEAFEKFSAARKIFNPLPAKMFKIRGSKEWNQANLWLGTKAAPTAFKIKTQLDAMAANQKTLMDTDITEAKRLTGVLSTVEWILLFVGIILSAVIGTVITRAITGPVNRIIEDLSEGSHQVSSAAGEISSSSQSMASGATEQASALEESSAALEELSAQTTKNAQSADEANNLSSAATQTANKGNSTVEKMIVSMNEMNESSKKISNIIKVIDEIAFQTNLLALNAAVEAARAGEHGKGFAVVAEEVRNLAQRSANAAKDTASLIEDSIKKTDEGTKMAGESGAVLKEIVVNSEKATSLIAEIATASREQADGVEQINKAVAEMDKITQSNAANAEETAAASEEMSAQSESLLDVVGQLNQIVKGKSSLDDSRERKAVAPVTKIKQKTPAKAPQRQLKAQQAKTVNPDEVIPMDDSDFKDF
jgi:methyl-accepting chemotaxis protein